MKELFSIYVTSMKIGVMTFGGGYAMLPILQREVVEKKKWNTEEEILDYYALAQCLMGIIMINTLAFVGEHRKGKIGGVVSALGGITPPLIIITLVATVLTAFSDMAVVQHAFAGIRVCVCVLVFNAVLKLWKNSVVDKKCLILFILVTAGSLLLDLTPIAFIIGAAVMGILIKTVGGKK